MECDGKISRLHETRVYHRTQKEYLLFYNTVIGSLDSVKDVKRILTLISLHPTSSYDVLCRQHMHGPRICMYPCEKTRNRNFSENPNPRIRNVCMYAWRHFREDSEKKLKYRIRMALYSKSSSVIPSLEHFHLEFLYSRILTRKLIITSTSQTSLQRSEPTQTFRPVCISSLLFVNQPIRTCRDIPTKRLAEKKLKSLLGRRTMKFLGTLESALCSQARSLPS